MGRFFLTFWLALLVAGIGVGTAVWLRHNAGQGEEAGYLIDVGHAASFVAVSENIIRHGGVAGLRSFLDSMRETPFPPVYAVDNQDRDILQRSLAPEILQQARTLFQQAAYPEAIRAVTADDGQRYLLFVPLPEHGFADRPPPMPDGGFAPPPLRAIIRRIVPGRYVGQPDVLRVDGKTPRRIIRLGAGFRSYGRTDS